MSTLRELSAKLETVPVLKTILAAYYERVFATSGSGMFRGVYGSFDEASNAAPRTKSLGFDHKETTTLYEDRLTRIFPEDYPVLFWLRPILQPGSSVFDFGGHRGVHFYAYAKYLEYPVDLKWLVCEVPEVVKAGRELAAQRNANRLQFTSDIKDADGATVFIAGGSLHYVESPSLADSLKALSRRPRHLILNKLPLYDGKSYVTLQNGKVAFHPLHVYNRAEYIGALSGLGYELIDHWPTPTRHGRIPFHPEVSFPTYTGLYLRLTKA